MKNKFLLIGLSFVLAFSSCKKDEETSAIVDGVDVKNPTYAAKTYTDAQKDVEKTGVDMVNQLKSINQEPGMQATVNLLELVNSSPSSSSVKSSYAFKTLAAVASLRTNKSNVTSLMKSLQSDEPLSISQAFDSISGVYTYNFSTNEFDAVMNPNSNAVVFIFPASQVSKDAKILDGKFEIAKPTFQKGPFSIDNGTIEELPTSAGYALSVNNTKVVSYDFTASYNSDGLPTNVSSTLSLGTFVFNVTWGYKETELSINYSFKHGETIIFDLGADASGSFTKESIENMNETITVTENYNGYTYTYQETTSYPERVLNNANAHFQFMDIKFAGHIDFKTMVEESRKFENDTSLTNDENVDKGINLINNNIQIVAVYASTNEAIAKVEAYPVINEYTYYYYDYNTDQIVTETRSEKDVDFRMVFANDKKVDFKTYFDSGFDNLITSFNSFIDELNTTYNWQLTHVDRTKN